jgi:hypothetical protein
MLTLDGQALDVTLARVARVTRVTVTSSACPSRVSMVPRLLVPLGRNACWGRS